MLMRICLIAAIVLGLAAGVVNLVEVRDKIQTTIKERDDYHATADKETSEHAKYQKLAKDTQTKLDATNTLLVATITERDSAVAQSAQDKQRADTAEATLKQAQADRDAAQNELAAWKALGIPLENIKATLASLKDVTEERDAIQEEKKVLQASLDRAQDKLDSILNPDHEVKMPPGLKGKVLVADPRYDFVILDIGINQGVKEEGKLLVNRNGKLIAMVRIKSVDADRSIANVMPGWKLSDVMEGDEVLY
jgi:hypothetical protein